MKIILKCKIELEKRKERSHSETKVHFWSKNSILMNPFKFEFSCQNSMRIKKSESKMSQIFEISSQKSKFWTILAQKFKYFRFFSATKIQNLFNIKSKFAIFKVFIKLTFWTKKWILPHCAKKGKRTKLETKVSEYLKNKTEQQQQVLAPS